MQLAQFKDLVMPMWSNDWLSRFKKRYGIRQHTLHGEAGSVDVNYVNTQRETLHKNLRPYASKDIYNGDESALFWKSIPDRALATTQMAGGKGAKARITAHFCCNATGTDKLPIWFIGMAAKPRCFATNGVAMEDLDMVWRHNKKG
jgi:hypothetical protein